MNSVIGSSNEEGIEMYERGDECVEITNRNRIVIIKAWFILCSGV
jgi:hypothetical protein